MNAGRVRGERMRFHIPSFLSCLDPALPYGVGYFHDKFTLYLFASFPVRLDFLQGVICEAVVKSCEHPVTLTETQQRSLIDGLLDAHRVTLRETLSGTQTYIKKHTERGERGERLSTYEYQVFLKQIDAIVRRVRVQEDAKLIQRAAKRARFVSVRFIQKYVMTNYGQAWSARRVSEALTVMQDAGALRENRQFVRRFGREVVG